MRRPPIRPPVVIPEVPEVVPEEPEIIELPVVEPEVVEEVEVRTPWTIIRKTERPEKREDDNMKKCRMLPEGLLGTIDCKYW